VLLTASRLVLAEALKEAEREYRAAQLAGDPKRFALAKDRLAALEREALRATSAVEVKA